MEAKALWKLQSKIPVLVVMIVECQGDKAEKSAKDCGFQNQTDELKPGFIS